MAGLYIHIPFCASRCVYCDFFSSTDFSFKRGYIDAVCRELELRIHELRDEPVFTVYLGGGDSVQFIAVGTRSFVSNSFHSCRLVGL